MRSMIQSTPGYTTIVPGREICRLCPKVWAGTRMSVSNPTKVPMIQSSPHPLYKFSIAPSRQSFFKKDRIGHSARGNFAKERPSQVPILGSISAARKWEARVLRSSKCLFVYSTVRYDVSMEQSPDQTRPRQTTLVGQTQHITRLIATAEHLSQHPKFEALLQIPSRELSICRSTPTKFRRTEAILIYYFRDRDWYIVLITFYYSQALTRVNPSHSFVGPSC
jgi:hypothetical protein